MPNVNFVNYSKVIEELKGMSDEYILIMNLDNNESICQIASTDEHLLVYILELLKHFFHSTKDAGMPLLERIELVKLLSFVMIDLVLDSASKEELNQFDLNKALRMLLSRGDVND